MHECSRLRKEAVSQRDLAGRLDVRERQARYQDWPRSEGSMQRRHTVNPARGGSEWWGWAGEGTSKAGTGRLKTKASEGATVANEWSRGKAGEGGGRW